MYFHTFGGSALLHLLAAHPKVVAALGLVVTVGLLASPYGPGRYVGTERHLARLEAAVRPHEAVTAERAAEAVRAAARLLEQENDAEIVTAIEHTLRRCGSGCTDLSTPMVSRDPVLLRRVLVLYELDQAAMRRQPSMADGGHGSDRMK